MSFRVLRRCAHMGEHGAVLAATHKEIRMAASSSRRIASRVLLFVVNIAIICGAHAQVAGANPSAALATWTMKINSDIRWQQVTPAGALLLATDSALIAV